MIQNQEDALRSYLHDAIKDEVPLTVLQLKISELDPSLRTENTLNTIVESFREPLYPYGRAFICRTTTFLLRIRQRRKKTKSKHC